MSHQKVTIIIPCYNEEKTIHALLERVVEQDLRALGLDREIVVADDGSTDASMKQVERFIEDHPDEKILICSYAPTRGKGHAVRQALDAATGDIVLIQDADLEYSPEDYPKLLLPILHDLAPVVYGSRWIAPQMPTSGTLYSLGGWLENRFLNLFYRTNISDIATGYKVFRADVLRDLNLECTGFEFCPEVTAKLLNRKVQILEVPIRYNPRKKSEGKKIRWTDFFIALYTILKVKLKKL